MTYCFLDLETTGLEPDADTILEIAWVFTDKHFNVLGSIPFPKVNILNLQELKNILATGK